MITFFLIYTLIGLIWLGYFWGDVIHEDRAAIPVLVFGWGIFLLLAVATRILRWIPEFPVKGGQR